MADPDISFVINGQRQGSGRAVRLAAQRGGGGDSVRLTATPGRDVVMLHLASGPTLVLHPENARDLLRAQGTATRGAVGIDVEVAPQLRWAGLEQAAPTRGGGFLGGALLSAFEIVTGSASLADRAATATVKRVDGQVQAGVYALDPAALQPFRKAGLKPAPVPAAKDGGPILVFIHGTFVDTASTFAKLWVQHPAIVRQIFDRYGGRVYALDHPTLGASPIANALTLVQALPQGAKLHLVTHSRGGLVAEVLARVAANPSIGKTDLAAFAGDAYAGQRAELQALAQAVAQRGIEVERVVRVACPARGTLLASTRLDAYVSVLKWGLELAGVPVLPELVDFLGEVAQCRADPALIPGLAAMMPGSPLVNWLNAAPAPIAGELRVIAGDLQGDSVGSWIKTLLADAYYWTDNDIVVQTRSMYGGAPRNGGASYLLDQGGKVTHFDYFSNDRTADAMAAALTQDAPAGFRSIGPLSWAGQSSTGQRGVVRGGDARAAADKPAVFLLPGILGSNLKAGGARVWLGPRIIGGLGLLRWVPGQTDVSPDGPIGMVYDELSQYLAASHEVIEFGYDWRAPVELEARRLGAALELALAARQASGQPVRIIAHSMGGVLARTMQLECPATWQRLMAHEQARLLMLGTPNGGSWAPMQVLSGDDTFGNTLAGIGLPLQDHAARQLMAEMPGFLQLQAGLADAQGLGSSATWQKLADDDLAAMHQVNWWHNYAGEAQEAAYRWGVPPQAVLDQARALRQRLDEQRDQALPAFAAKMLLVIGHAKFTPDGYERGSDNTVVYLDATDGGDGRVPRESALLPGVATWCLDTDHGSLPSTASAFDAYLELLQTGSTERLARLQATATRGAASAAVHVRSRPSRGRLAATPVESERAVFASPRAGLVESPDAPAGAALVVAVHNGNLAFVGQPLLVGHYRSQTLTGTEKAVDGLVGGAMSASLAAGRYPTEVGTAQVFIHRRHDPTNPWRGAQAQNVVVVGLGDEGQLRERDLAASVRQGSIAWAERVAQGADGAGTQFEIAATLLGSGGVGVHTSTAARAIAQGVRDANDYLAATGWPVVSRLVLVELYLDRATDAWHGLQLLADASPGRFDVEATISAGNGALRRPADSGYRGADYDFVTATTAAEGTIEFTLDSKRARTELRAQVTQAKLVRELVTRGSSASNADADIGRTLFQLLVPPEIEPFLAGTEHMLLELDDGTAPIPWELLDTPQDRRGGGDPRPWAVRSRLLRKLRTSDYREQVADASAEDNVLVIGEPLIEDPAYPRLPGALAEAKAVARQFGAAGGIAPEHLVSLCDRNDAPTIVGALLSRRYRIVHIAGHGEPGDKGGVVMSGGTFLGPREIKTMRTVPELVFVNCCHGAARVPGQTLRDLDRASFAAGIADQLIRIGVRCVVAAGWAVDDGPASLFATTFYRALLGGAPFIAAVAQARELAWQQGGNTWAAYQCYGDPNWIFRRDGDGAATSAPVDDSTAIGSPLALAVALEELAVQSRWQGAAAAAQLAKVQRLEARFGELWGGMGAVAEAFGLAYAEAGARPQALAWYRRAQCCNDASASMKVNEQLGNLLAREAWAAVADLKPGGPRWSESRAQLAEATTLLEQMATLAPTIERLSLVGSAWKRLAMLERRCHDADAELRALDQAAQAYGRAEQTAALAGHPELFYPALNRMATALVLALARRQAVAFDAAATEAARRSAAAKAEAAPDFWSVTSLVDLDFYEALRQGALADQLAALQTGYEGIHARVDSASMWDSKADQAEFVLLPYLDLASAAERRAAATLLAQLRGYAGR